MKDSQAWIRNKVKITNALNLIWDHIDHNLNLDLISQSCNLSKYHFHRIFIEHQGETLGSYIARKRLERAANRLILFPDFTISLIASSLGYSSPANFSKAFNKYTGISPKQWRHAESLDVLREGNLNSKYGKLLDPFILYSKYKFADKYARLERLEELDKIISITKLNEQHFMYLSTHDGTNPIFWKPLWVTMNKWISSNMENRAVERFGIWYDNMDICPIELMRYDGAIALPENIEVKAPYMIQKRPAGYYATGKLSGTPDTIRLAVKDIYTFWLVERGYLPGITQYYEKYLTDFDEKGHHQIQFYIRLKPKRRLAIN